MPEEENKDSTEIAKVDKEEEKDALTQLLFYGDLSALSQEEKNKYLFALCKSLGMNPWLKPFDMIPIRGKLIVYANKGAAAQLRDIRKISTKLVYAGPFMLGEQPMVDYYQVTFEFSDPDGRTSSNTGLVPVKGLSGEDLTNAIMRCWTKAERRGTLSHAGIGLTDESELDSIPEARARQEGPRIINPAPQASELTESPVSQPALPPPKASAQAQVVRPGQGNGLPKALAPAKPPINIKKV